MADNIFLQCVSRTDTTRDMATFTFRVAGGSPSRRSRHAAFVAAVAHHQQLVRRDLDRAGLQLRGLRQVFAIGLELAVEDLERVEPGVVVEKVRNLTPGEGLNAATGEYVDMVETGIIDPAKVTRSALQNAASIAALFLTTEAVVADKPEKAAAPAGDPTGGMGGMDF